LGLARAVYNLPKFVVLDEPNSNLDDAGNNALIEAIKTLQSHGSTIIVVSHRNDLMPLADHLVVMASGTVVDAGPAEEVSARVGAHQASRQPATAMVPATSRSRPTDGKPQLKRPQTVTWPTTGE
jgi:ABC-type protease/lipase transport system fused ATPase/permease subunit